MPALMFHWPPERMSLYGTTWWDRLSEQDRVLLSQHEAASMAAAGIWFEMFAIQIAHTNPVSREMHRFVMAGAAMIVARSLINPRVYTAVGLPRLRARRVALRNPDYRAHAALVGKQDRALFHRGRSHRRPLQTHLAPCPPTVSLTVSPR